MSTKITLTLETSVIENAKAYARKHQQNLSELVSNYFKGLVVQEEKVEVASDEDGLSPIVRSLKGSIPMPADIDYKQVLIDSLSEKYL